MTELPPAAPEILKRALRERDPALAEAAAEQFRLLGDQAGEAASYAALAEMRFCAGSYQESAGYYRRSLEIYQALQFKKEEAECLYSLARCLAFTDEAEAGGDEATCLEQALAIAEEIAARELQVECCLRLGACLREKDSARARSFYLKALALLENAGAGWLSAICQQGLAHLYARDLNNLKARKHYLAAIEHFEQARQSNKDAVDLRLAQCHESLGDLALREDDQAEALNRYQKAISVMAEKEAGVGRRIRDKLDQLINDDF